MSRINLLPWREASRELRRRRYFRVLVVMVLLGAGVILLADVYISRIIERLHLRNQYLEQASVRLDDRLASLHELKSQRQQLIERMKIVEELQEHRSSSVQFFEQLARSLPDGVYFTELEQQGRSLDIKGAAESNERVSELLRNLQFAEGFAAPELGEVRQAAEGGQGLHNRFRLRVQQVPLSSRDLMP
ncbi:MAG: PilN domain-containing protein [Pseudomonas sp.]|uniref:PilN domain-containing protein n=1 Tax=Pseudomonas sp. TaxID=306 RepID=UPI003D0EA06D